MEVFDGFKIINCSKCKSRNKIFFKKGEKLMFCPTCGEKLNNDNILKTINKKAEGIRRFDYSIETEENCFFDY